MMIYFVQYLVSGPLKRRKTGVHSEFSGVRRSFAQMVEGFQVANQGSSLRDP